MEESISKSFDSKEIEKDNIDLNDTMNLDFNINDEIEKSGFEFDILEDGEWITNILGNFNNKNIEQENKNLAKLEKANNAAPLQKKKKNKKPISNKLKFTEEKLSKKLKKLFLEAYNIISQKYYDKIENDEENEKETKYMLDLIDQILLEDKNNNCEISLVFENKEKNNCNDREFIINVYVLHKIQKFNNLLTLTIIFKVKLEMSFRSGNVKLSITKFSIDYQNKKQVVIMRPNFKCLLINNRLGNYSITYCTCGNCMNCKNRIEPKPFDDVLLYLRKKNKTYKIMDYTELWFGKYNRYRNESNYKCSFCTDFFQKKLNIVKLFCNPDYDSDHTCQFWICRDCYINKKRSQIKNVICPNCKKFVVNFTKLNSIYRYYYWKEQQNILV